MVNVLKQQELPEAGGQGQLLDCGQDLCVVGHQAQVTADTLGVNRGGV